MLNYYRYVVTFFSLVVITFAAGCSGAGAAMTAGRMTMNLMKGGSNLRIFLDGQAGKQSMLKKAVAGHSNWKIKEPVSTSPTLKFQIKKPEKFGRITFTSVSIFQKFQADYSHQAEFTVVPRDNKAASQLKPDTDYDLGNPPAILKILDLRGDEVKAVELLPGMKYQIQLTIKADKSETARIFFVTK